MTCHSGCHWTPLCKSYAVLNGKPFHQSIFRDRLDAQATSHTGNALAVNGIDVNHTGQSQPGE